MNQLYSIQNNSKNNIDPTLPTKFNSTTSILSLSAWTISVIAIPTIIILGVQLADMTLNKEKSKINYFLSTPTRVIKQIIDKNNPKSHELVIAKAACIARIFFSIKTLPFLLLIGLVAGGINIYKNGIGEKTLTGTLGLLKKHLFYNIPYCFTALCQPISKEVCNNLENTHLTLQLKQL